VRQPALERRLVLVGVAERHHRARRQRSLHHPPDGETPEVVRSIEVGDERLQWSVGSPAGAGTVSTIESSSGAQVGVLRRDADAGDRPTLPRDGAEHREVDVLLGHLEVEEQLVDLVHHRSHAGVGAVDLVDDHDRRDAAGDRLREDVAGLRHRSLCGVHEEQDPVDECERPLDLPAEVGVAGRVDQVDLHALPLIDAALARIVIPALPLLIVGVHDPIDRLLVRGEHARRLQHGVDERGLSVIDMRDERDVPERSGGITRHGQRDGTGCGGV
jgi:hypothetical protein